MILRIKNWNSIYENHNSRKLKRLDFVLVPVGMDTDGYTALMEHPNAAAHLGAWIALLQIAAKCKERGTLVNSDGRPHTAKSLGRISRINPTVFEELIPRLLSDEIQWLECETPSTATQRENLLQSPAIAENAGDNGTPTVLFPSILFNSSKEKEPAKVLRFENAPPGYALDELYSEFRQVWFDNGAAVNEESFMGFCWREWRILDSEQKLAAIKVIREWADPKSPKARDPALWNNPRAFLEGRMWTLPPRPKPKPREINVMDGV